MPLTIRFRSRPAKPRLSYTRILGWCDEFKDRLGVWPMRGDKFIATDAEETWGAIDRSLTQGTRGLPGGTTLAKLLMQYRGRQHFFLKPDFTVDQILTWADAFHATTGDWPKYQDGAIASTTETWSAVQTSLQRGTRGLPGGGSLAQLLDEHRGVKNHLAGAPLTAKTILRWADHHRMKRGTTPSTATGRYSRHPGKRGAGLRTHSGPAIEVSRVAIPWHASSPGTGV